MAMIPGSGLSRRWPVPASARFTRWCSADFLPDALKDRILDSDCQVLTAQRMKDCAAARKIPLKASAESGFAELPQCACLRLVVERTRSLAEWD